MIKKYFTRTLFLAGVSSLLLACGADSKTEKNEVEPPISTTSEEQISDSEQAIIDANEINFVMPSPLQIAAIFKRAGLGHTGGVTNTPDNVSKYSDRVSKALNFGVYAADLSYCVLNKESQDAIKYMKAVKTLSDDLGMSSMFGSLNMFSSFEHNLENEDSLIYILATIQENLDEHLESSEQQYMSVVFFSGGWVEGMHIGVNVAKKGHPSISSRLIEQMVILENVIQALEKYPHESVMISEVIAAFKDIDKTYRNFESLKGADMDEISFADIRITEEELNLVTEKVEKIRALIVNG